MSDKRKAWTTNGKFICRGGFQRWTAASERHAQEIAAALEDAESLISGYNDSNIGDCPWCLGTPQEHDTHCAMTRWLESIR